MGLVPIFDGHNDVLLRLWRGGDFDGRSFLERSEKGHVDLPRAREGGLAGGLFATFVPDETSERLDALIDASKEKLDLPPMPRVERSRALDITLAQAAILFRLERASAGDVRICRTVGDLRESMAAGRFAAVLHAEGAEAIGPELVELEVLYQAGLRSLGLVWSRPTIFGEGVPFRFPASPDIGAGLTDVGRALVRACNDLGVLIDLSHLNEKGFWDVARLSRAPLVATHSNVHAISPVSRNLTEDQLAAIRDSGGVVGLNFAVFFLRPDARRDPETPLSMMVRHLDHLLETLGPRGVALGSDFDGGLIAREIGDASGLPALVDAMRAGGYDEALIARIASENWLDVLERSWEPGR